MASSPRDCVIVPGIVHAARPVVKDVHGGSAKVCAGIAWPTLGPVRFSGSAQ